MMIPNAIDIKLFLFINGFLGRSLVLDSVILFFAEYAVFVLVLIVALSLIKDYGRESKERFRANLIGLIATSATVMLVTELIHKAYYHPRPLFALGTPHILFETSNSFPSTHTIFLFGLATAVYFYDRRLALILYIGGFLVGIARIAAGVHFPSDILGGIILGIFFGLIVEYMTRRFLPLHPRKRTVRES
jgi:undecaprenyl-diphosphatase